MPRTSIKPTPQRIHAPSDDNRQYVTALARGLEVLRCFSAGNPELGTKEIGDRIGLPQPTVWRLCYTLTRLGYLVPGNASGKLRVGAAALALGYSALDALQPLDALRPHLQSLANDYPAAVTLTVRHQLTMLYLLRCEGDTEFVMKLPPGSSVPLMSTTVGATCLATMPADELDMFVLQAQLTADDELTLKGRLAHIREQLCTGGFALSINERPGVNYASAPVPGLTGRSDFVLLCGGPSFGLPRNLLVNEIGTRLVHCAIQISEVLARMNV
jgi:DNA-binding IclR family transcriptional regulator